MPTNPYQSYDTADIYALVKQGPGWVGYTEAEAELSGRFIKAGDADDAPNTRGGIRPKHAPILP